MTGYNEIRDAVFKLLKTSYPSVNIYGEEIQQGFKRPAFFVQLILQPATPINQAHRQKSVLIIVHYYSPAPESSRYRDLWDMADALDMLFDTTLKLSDRELYIRDTEPEIVDEVLQYQFNLSFLDSRNDAVVIPLNPGAVPSGETDTEQIIQPNPELGYVDDKILPMGELKIKEEF